MIHPRAAHRSSWARQGLAGHREAGRRGEVAGASVGLVAAAFLLTACGGDQVAAPPSAAPSSSATTASRPTATPTPSPTSPSPSPSPSSSGGWTASGPSFGVDRARWPTTAEDAEAVLDRLPRTLEGQRLETYASPGEDGSGPGAGAEYGEDLTVTVSQAYMTDDTEDGSSQLMGARDLLAANFLLGLACSESSYRGNALPLGDEGYPEVPRGKPVWFSCAVDGAEGDDDFTAHAAGWTSGKTAWLVLAPDRSKVRSLVSALHDAAS